MGRKKSKKLNNINELPFVRAPSRNVLIYCQNPAFPNKATKAGSIKQHAQRAAGNLVATSVQTVVQGSTIPCNRRKAP
jgi:hypothetical protein